MRLWEWRGRLRPDEGPFNPCFVYSPERSPSWRPGRAPSRKAPPPQPPRENAPPNLKEIKEAVLDALSTERDTAWSDLVLEICEEGDIEERDLRWAMNSLLRSSKIRSVTKNVYRLPIKRPLEYCVDTIGRRRPTTFQNHEGLDACIVAQLSPYRSVQSKDLRQAVIDDYGTINERIIYNHLKKLVAKGEILRVSADEENGERNFTLGGYYRLPRKRRGPESEDSSP